ncbi:MAG TPA: tetratricopeptide repeat protein [Bacteroidia bacterium]|nr:tetratricopeptide repeat protein [Bacteroidia bacterium]
MSGVKKATVKKGAGVSQNKFVQKNQGLEKSKWWWIGILPLLLFAYLVYTPALKNSITSWDDSNYIVENKDIQSLDKDFIRKSFALHSGYVMGNFHPVTMISYALEYKYSKLNPRTYHLTNVILHLLNGVLVYLFIWLLTGRLLVTIITAALFLLHPMHVESVAWISERKDLLYCLFEMGALSAYIAYVKKGKFIFYLFCFVLFILALLSKAMAVAMVGLLPLLDFYFNRKLSQVKVIAEKIPFLIVGIIFGLIAIEAQNEFEAIYTDIRPLSDRFLFAGYSFITYLWKAFLPIHLSCFYDYPAKGTYSWYLLYVFLSIGLFLLAILSLRKTKKILFAFLFFTFSIALVLQLIPVGGAILAERYTYIPYIGIFYLIGEGICYLRDRRAVPAYKNWYSVSTVALVVFVILISSASNSRCKVWKDTISIWDDVLRQDPNVIKAYGGRGDGYNDQQRYPEAIRDLTKALEMKTDYAEAYYNRGLSYYFMAKQNQDSGNMAEAQRYYELSIRDNSSAIHYQPNLARAYYNRAGNYFLLKKYDLALSDALKAKELGMEVDTAFIDHLEQQTKAK